MGFKEHKLANPALVHLAVARRLERPPLEFGDGHLMQRHRYTC